MLFEVITDRFLRCLFYCGSHEGSREAELDVELHPLGLTLNPLHPQVVHQHQGLNCFLHSLKLNHATSSPDKKINGWSNHGYFMIMFWLLTRIIADDEMMMMMMI